MVSCLIKHQREIKPHKSQQHLHSTLSATPTISMVNTKNPNYKGIINKPIKPCAKVSIVQTQSSSTSLFQLKNLSHSQLKLMVMNPHLIKVELANLVETTTNDVLKPFNIPDLSDLALCPKSLRITYEWLINNSDSSNIHTNLAEVSRFCIPCLPMFREVFSMGEGIHHLEVPSYSSLLKFITFDHLKTTRITLGCRTSQLRCDWRDGRTTSMRFEKFEDASKSLHVSTARQLVPREATIAIWNCRGMGCCGFLSALDDITENHGADVVILLEVRTPKFGCKSILQHIHYTSLSIKDPVGLCGGIAVITTNRLVQVQLSSSSRNYTDLELRGA